MFFALSLLSVPCIVFGVSITITSPKTGDIVRFNKPIDPMEPDAASNIFPLKFESEREHACLLQILETTFTVVYFSSRRISHSRGRLYQSE